MKPLALYQHIFTWLRIFPFPNGTDRKTMRLSLAISVSFLLVDALSLISTIIYMYDNLFNSQSCPGCSFYPILQISGYGGTLYNLVVAHIIRFRIKSMFDKVQKIYDESSEEMKGFLDEVNRKNDRIVAISLKYSPLGSAIYLAAIGISNVLYCLLKYGYVSADHLFYPARFSLPWDQNTIVGWIGMLICAMLSCVVYIFLNIVFMALFASICNIHKAFYMNSKHLLQQLNELTEKEPIKPANSRRISPLIGEIMENGNNGKEFFKQSADVYSSFLFFQVIFDMMFASGTIFQMEVAVENSNMMIANLLIGAATGFSNLFVYCYIGYRASSYYTGIADLLYQSNWNRLPIKYRKFFKLMIQDAQHPVQYHGFKIIQIGLGTLTNILNTVYKYYTIMKTLSGYN